MAAGECFSSDGRKIYLKKMDYFDENAESITPIGTHLMASLYRSNNVVHPVARDSFIKIYTGAAIP